MIRKTHLKHTVTGGPTCQKGRSGGQLRGEHITFAFAEFVAEDQAVRCERCASSKLFAFLLRRAATAGV